MFVPGAGCGLCGGWSHIEAGLSSCHRGGGGGRSCRRGAGGTLTSNWDTSEKKRNIISL